MIIRAFQICLFVITQIHLTLSVQNVFNPDLDNKLNFATKSLRVSEQNTLLAQNPINLSVPQHGTSAKSEHGSETQENPHLHEQEEDEWDYEYQEDWAQQCQTGAQQSPINLITAKAICASQLEVEFIPNANTLDTQISTKDRGLLSPGPWSKLYFKLNSQKYIFDARQFHLHVPSQHTINGKYYDAEIHIVHGLNENSPALQKELAVMGFLFQRVKDDKVSKRTFFDDWMYNITNGTIFKLQFSDAIRRWIDPKVPIYHYNGSVTTPNHECQEIVSWFVYGEPLEISETQFYKVVKAITSIGGVSGVGANNREVQPHNNRIIENISPSCTEGFKTAYTNHADESFIEIYIVLFLSIALCLYFGIRHQFLTKGHGERDLKDKDIERYYIQMK